jgi:hypothetical protein
MKNIIYEFKMNSTHHGENNSIKTFNLFIKKNEIWNSIVLDNESPGFLTFLISLIKCHSLYFRVNCAENATQVKDVEAIFTIKTINWKILNLFSSFTATIYSGAPTDELKEFIKNRMLNCPVSRNLEKNITKETQINFL